MEAWVTLLTHQASLPLSHTKPFRGSPASIRTRPTQCSMPYKTFHDLITLLTHDVPMDQASRDARKDHLVTWNVTLRLVLHTCLILTLKMSRITWVEGIVRNPACRPLFLGGKHLNYSRKRAGLVSMTSPFPGSDFKAVPLTHSVLDKEQKYPTGNYAHLKLTLMIGLRNSLNPVAVFHIGIQCKATL